MSLNAAKRCGAALLAMMVLASCNEDTLSQTGPDRGAERKSKNMISLVTKSSVIDLTPKACPLDVYGSKPNQAGDVANCKNNPRQCISQCEAGNRRACFDAAQVIEAAQVLDDNQATYPLYVKGCELGDANACVNAMATIKNTFWSVPRPAKAATASCRFKTFKRMCDENASWGCYMTAREYRHHGDGGYVKNSEAKHDTYMRRACKISATSGACLEAYK